MSCDVFLGSRYVLGGFVSDGELQINVAPGIPRPDCESADKLDRPDPVVFGSNRFGSFDHGLLRFDRGSRRPRSEYWLT
jgi:hypothetical protein